ncbi:MAG TPA: hypothetical protein VGK81_05280 [Anaerolineae bacterium]
MKRLILSAFIGVVLGVVGARYLFVGSFLSLIPWGLAGLLIGYWAGRPRVALANGGLYGFAVAFIFMLAGYQGEAPIISRIPFFALLGLVGAICGIVLGWMGSFVWTTWLKH